MELEELLKGPKRTEKGGGVRPWVAETSNTRPTTAQNRRNAIGPKQEKCDREIAQRERGTSWRPRRKEKRPDDRRGRKKRKENVTTW